MPFPALIAALVLTSAAEVSDAVRKNRPAVDFVLEATLSQSWTSNSISFAVEDASGAAILRNESLRHRPLRYAPGDRLRIKGNTAINEYGRTIANAHKFERLGHETEPRPITASVEDVLSGKLDNRLVTVSGIVREVFRDEIDPNWIYIVLNCTGKRIPLVFSSRSHDLSEFNDLIGTEVAGTGICNFQSCGLRRIGTRQLEILDPGAIRVLSPSPSNPFEVTPISNDIDASHYEIERMGLRRITGRVVAGWDERHFMIRDVSGDVHRIELIEGTPPKYGMTVDVTGFPKSDLYNINLTSAKWRAATIGSLLTSSNVASDAPLTTADLLDKKYTRQNLLIRNQGRAICVTGLVRDMKIGQGKYRTCTIHDGPFSITINSGAECPFPDELSINSRIKAIGTCLAPIGPWDASAAFPHVTDDLFVVLRKPGDLVIVANPPWWTTERLLAVIASLLAALAAILLWNLALRRLVERRGRALFKAEIGKAGAELRIGERTRLAVELHDSLAQNLTAISFQLSSAIRSRKLAPEASDAHLKSASDMLHSCRTELRRCLWDLRSDTLEARDFAEAIRKTVETVTDGATLHIRFNVPRVHVSDTTTHAILCIIRELAANAVRHGHAKNVWVAGELVQRLLRFSVRDDGYGFNPAHRPGEDTGHFGIKGIRERLNPLNGELTYTPVTCGTRAVVTINLPHIQDENTSEN